ncbi:MAG TPA: hypothetical protein VE863_19740 [Pyrinomonadaceae bacterium]|jgi:hypothetical protein|nr:hypothetical protein [Pyrinomonadaceae bacterium]
MLIPYDGSIQRAPTDLERAFVVNFAKPSHERIYLNTTFDIGFFPCLKATIETLQLRKLKDRSRVIVVDSRGTAAQRMLRSGHEFGFVMFQWSGGDRLAPSDERAKSFASTGQQPQSLRSWQYWETAGRRHSFKKPDRLYVQLSILPDGLRRSLVWRPVLDCIPNHYYRPERTDAYGEFLAIKVRERTAAGIKDVAKIFDRIVVPDEYSSQREFVGEVAEAMARVEELKPEIEQLDLRSKPMESRRELLRFIGVGAR